MKRVLIISYYWPPSAGSGVQRWLKFSKYLPENGWQPVIYTPENPSYQVKDDSFLKDIPVEVEIVKTPIWEPYGFYQKLRGGKADKNLNNGILDKKQGGLLSKVSSWVRGNVFIPDPKIFWVNKSVSFLSKYLKENPVDVIISTGPPHSMHLIALGLKKHINTPWIADFRDPWSKLDLLDDYNISKSSRKKYEHLEKQVLTKSDVCLTVSNNWGKMFSELGASRVEVITNGYDTEDVKLENIVGDKFIVSHFGLLNHMRNPKPFWRALNDLCNENEYFRAKFELHLGGTLDAGVLDELNQLEYLKPCLNVHPYISHEEVLKWYSTSSLLLLLTFESEIGKGNIPGKLFEYLAMNKPVIAFGHESGDVAEILSQIEMGWNFEYQTGNVESIKKTILESFNSLPNPNQNHEFEKFNRESLTKRLVNLLDNIS